MRSATKRSALSVLAAMAMLAPLTRALPRQSSGTQQPANRVVQPIDLLHVVRLKGNVHPRALPQYDQGPVEPSFQLSYITIEFNRTPQQQQDFAQLLKDQQDPSSANYHKWLTPEQYAARFGLSASDIAAVAAWLTQQGFTVVYVARGRNYIAFRGTAAQVQSTFQTQIHRFVVNGEQHFANVSEPAIPEALAGVVLGVGGLHDFTPKPLLKKSPVILDGTIMQPDAVEQVNPLTPTAFGAIYDVAPLYAAGFTGSGIAIAIVGEAEPDFSDVATFRSKFSLPPNVPQAILTGTDPGVKPLNSGVVVEEILDLEWAGAVAPGATLLYVYSSGVEVALTYAIDNNLAPIISMSYGGCEADGGSNILEPQLQKAAAQGMTLLISSGDSGPAECDPPQAAQAMNGLAVQYPSSSPEVTAVGGTSFQQSSGTGYIPETTWNDTYLGGLESGGGGASAIFAKPSWQTGPGVPSDGFRDVPDVSLAASPQVDPYSVIYNKGVTGYVGGTSASAPSLAGIVALLNQYLVASGALSAPGLGIINPMLYQFSQTSPSSFHDITSGNILVPCELNTPNCTTGQFGYDARPGYDQATGLGSVDANNLAAFWSTAPFISFSATNLTFAAQYAGSTSAAQTVTLANHGNGPLGISGITASGDFAQTNTCGTSIPVSGSCTISVMFTPTVLGPDAGSISIAESPAGNPFTVNLSGTSVSSVSLSPASLTFGPQLTGTSSTAQAVTLTNKGPVALTINFVAIGPGFTQTNNCGSTVAPAGTCTINVVFKPVFGEYQTGQLSVVDNAIGSPQSVNLAGTGSNPITFSPSSLSFASQLAGVTSPPQTVTLTNNLSTTLTISSIVATVDFAATNTCGTSLAAGSACTLSVTFTPTDLGLINGSISVTDNAPAGPQNLNVSGTSVSTVALSTADLTFANQGVGGASSPQAVTLTNKAPTPLTITSIASVGLNAADFSVTQNCVPSVPPAGSCTVNAAFTPTALGQRIAVINIVDNAIGGPQTMVMQGTGVTQLALSASSVAFGNVEMGTTSAVQMVTLTNQGGVALAISGITITGANASSFTDTQNCASGIPLGGSCTVSVAFQPSAIAPFGAALQITDSALGSPHTVSLSGSGIDLSLSAPAASVTVTAGQPANYTLQLSQTGGAGISTIDVRCTGAPTAATCAVNPASLNSSGTFSTSVQVTVATTAHSSIFVRNLRNRRLADFPSPPWVELLCWLTLLSMGGLFTARRQRFAGQRLVALSLLIGLVTLLIACGGGSASTAPSPSALTGTPAGTYALTVTATQSGATRSTTLTLIVQ